MRTAERGLGLRIFYSEEGTPTNQAFTTRARRHDSIRPDFTGWFLDGVLVGSEHVAKELAQASDLTAETEPAEDQGEVVRIEGTSSSGRVALKSASGSPPRLKSARLDVSPSLFREDDQLEGATIEVEVSEYAEVDGLPVATAGTATYTYRVVGEKEPIVKRFTTRRSDLLANPDFDGLNAFRIDIPDGTVIYDYDIPNTRYRWKEGKLIPYVEDSLETAIDSLVETESFPATMGPPSESNGKASPPQPPAVPESGLRLSARALVIGLLGVLVAVSVALFRQRRRRRNPASPT